MFAKFNHALHPYLDAAMSDGPSICLSDASELFFAHAIHQLVFVSRGPFARVAGIDKGIIELFARK